MATVLLILLGCNKRSPTESTDSVETCGPFGSWESSPYALPYPTGTAYFVDQANCSGFGHSQFWRHGYDFLMPIGTTVIASRSGTVIHSEGRFVDGDRNGTNLVTIGHSDGTVMLYSHLTQNGNLVPVGQFVAAGETVGLSGVTGDTGGVPHLHLSLHPCSNLPGLIGSGSTCPSSPFNFSNTDPNPLGLTAKRNYAAR